LKYVDYGSLWGLGGGPRADQWGKNGGKTLVKTVYFFKPYANRKVRVYVHLRFQIMSVLDLSGFLSSVDR
jgi:hypothetical protein